MNPKGLIAAAFATVLLPAGAFEYALAPERSYFDASVWRNRDVIVIPAEGVALTEPTTFIVDELILKGPLTSNGFPLRIDALRITFEDGGLIRAFDGPAAAGAARANGAAGMMSTSDEGTGGDGHAPIKADPGVDGLASPAAIVISTVQLNGKPNFDLTGQGGGRGGAGGSGGVGGRGGPGHRAKVGCWTARHPGGDGGAGGRGGPGGNGGDGGAGGAPVPLVLASGDSVPNDMTLITGKGQPGEGGPAGRPGSAGAGGPGGYDAVATCFLYRKSASGGKPGRPGPEQLASGQAGSPGKSAPDIDDQTEPLPSLPRESALRPGLVVVNFKSLETLRNQLVPAWANFHWARTLEFLILDTLTEAVGRTRVLETDDLNSDATELANRILQDLDRDRLASLRALWSEYLTGPVEALDYGDREKLGTLPATARNAVKLLSQLSEEGVDAAAIATSLRALNAEVTSQVSASLANAIESCHEFNEEKRRQLPTISALTTRYTIPACEGRPDLRRPENVDKQITLYRRQPAFFPANLATLHQRVARSTPSLILNEAYAEDFEVLDLTQSHETERTAAARLPRAGVWMESGLGVFTGMPRLHRAQSLKEIAMTLQNLRRNLSSVQR